MSNDTSAPCLYTRTNSRHVACRLTLEDVERLEKVITRSGSYKAEFVRRVILRALDEAEVSQ
jgi:predicted DNA-binding protein